MVWCSPYLVLPGGLVQSIFALASGLVQSIICTARWVGAVHTVLLGGSVQSIFGTAGWFGEVYIWYCQVVCCSPCLVLPGGSVQPILGNTERFFVAGHIGGLLCGVCGSPCSVCTAEWMFDAV